MKFNIKAPCANCPFRKKGGVGPLGKKRAAEIVENITNDSVFACHKTTGAESGESVPQNEHSACAGALILQEKAQGWQANVLLRIAYLAGWLKPDELRGQDEVCDNPEDFIKQHTI